MSALISLNRQHILAQKAASEAVAQIRPDKNLTMTDLLSAATTAAYLALALDKADRASLS